MVLSRIAIFKLDKSYCSQVCHFPAVLTCVVTINGAAQVKARDQAVVLKPGESTYILPNQPPRAPFCADLTEVRDWLFQMRGTQPASDLGSLAVKWLQKPCATPTGALAAASSTAVPSSTTAAAAAPATSATAALSLSASAAPSATLALRPVTPTNAAAGPLPPGGAHCIHGVQEQQPVGGHRLLGYGRQMTVKGKAAEPDTDCEEQQQEQSEPGA